ncbi:MAG: DegT/DnrJ/EryC1/StrS family aminotransferase [Spirochaetales bacterium]|nr:DegT/DnrJ/EryC1/StrS family aminotransferase [Spirochaetales bacterium]
MKASTDFVPFAQPSIGPEEEEAVLEVMRSGWLTTGKVTLAFEQEFAARLGVERALAVNSATSGLHLALEALGVGPGDVVVTSPYTFASTAAVARQLGAEVVFCDIEEEGYNLDPEALGAVLARTRNVKALIAVHVGGLPCRLDLIAPLCERYGVALVEDAAHAFPSKLPQGYAGTIGDVGVFSFYATKTITTGEGGMVVARDGRVRERISLMRSHGIDRAVWDRYTARTAAWSYSVVEAGYKYNLPDLLAAIGRVQLSKAERFLAEREAIAARYDEAFAELAGIRLPPRGPGHAWHLYALSVDAKALGFSRDEFIERLRAEGVGASVHFIPLHLMPYWAGRYGLVPDSFPRALAAFNAEVSLPASQGLDAASVERVAASVRKIVGAGA